MMSLTLMEMATHNVGVHAGNKLTFDECKAIAKSVCLVALSEARDRVRRAKHGEIAAANIAMLIGELK